MIPTQMRSNEETVNLESDREIPFSPLQAKDKRHSLHIKKSHMTSAAYLSSTWMLRTIQFSSTLRSMEVVFMKSKLNLLLPFGSLAVMTHLLTGKHGWVFFFSIVGIIPIAHLFGYATDQLAYYVGNTVGGLLNTAFGNAVEMIISICALRNGMIRIVQLSLLGSLLSNMLLVLGCAFFTADIVHHNEVQVFNKAGAIENSGLLLVAVMGILLPTVLLYTHTEVHVGRSEIDLSRFTSCMMLVAYASYLLFHLKSQSKLYSVKEEGESDAAEDSDDGEAPEVTMREAICYLTVSTMWVSILSGYITDAIQQGSDSWNVPVAFVSVILLPLVGKIPDIITKMDKLDIRVKDVIGSSTQISMFVIPFCVVVGWFMGQPMDLNFHLFETVALFLAMFMVSFLLQGRMSNSFRGLLLILGYLIVAGSFYGYADK